MLLSSRIYKVVDTKRVSNKTGFDVNSSKSRDHCLLFKSSRQHGEKNQHDFYLFQTKEATEITSFLLKPS